MRQRSAPIERHSPSSRPWSGRRRNHAARFPATNISQPALALFSPLNSTRDAINAPQLSRWGAGRLGARPEIAAEVIGHQLDLFLRPQPAASDHPIDRGLPSAAILPLVAKHRIGMALEALAHHHLRPGCCAPCWAPSCPWAAAVSNSGAHASAAPTFRQTIIAFLSRLFWSSRVRIVQSVRRRIRVGQYAALNLSPWPPLAPPSGAPPERCDNRKTGERPTDAPPIDARNDLDFFRQRRVQKPAAFGQIVERSLQFLRVLARQSARRRRHRMRRGGALLFGTRRSLTAGSPAQQWQAQRACALGRLALLDGVILLGRLAGRLRRARLPGVLHEAHARPAQQTLDARDGVALAIEEMADAAQKIEVVRAIVAPPAAALHRPDLTEAAFPEPQHVLRNVELLRHFADGPE